MGLLYYIRKLAITYSQGAPTITSLKLFGKNFQTFWFNFEVKLCFRTKTSEWFSKKYLPALKLQNLCPSFSLRLILVSWLQPLCHQFFPLIFLRPDFFLFDESSQNYRPIFNDKFLCYLEMFYLYNFRILYRFFFFVFRNFGFYFFHFFIFDYCLSQFNICTFFKLLKEEFLTISNFENDNY